MSGDIPLLPRVYCWDAQKLFYYTCSKAEGYAARRHTIITVVQRFPRRVHVPTYVHMCILLCFVCTGYTQKNGAVSKVNNKFISHLTWAQRTPSAAATIQVFHALPAVRFSCLLRGRGASFQDGVAAGKGFLCAPF